MTTPEFVIWLIAIGIALTIAATIELRHRRAREDENDPEREKGARDPQRRTR